MEKWKKEMWKQVRSCELTNPYDIRDLYIKLEQISKKYLLSGEMNSGSYFNVPLKIRSNLRLTFFKNSTSIIQYNASGFEEEILSRKDSTRRENNKLKFLSTQLEMRELGIGLPYPKELYNVLFSLEENDIISFEEGRSYIFEGFNKSNYVLREIHSGDFDDFEICTHKNAKVYEIDLTNEAHLQKLYDENKKSSDILGYTRVTKKTYDRLYNALKKKLSRISTNKIDLGPVSLRGKLSMFGNQAMWYSENGNKIEEKDVKYLLGYLNTIPQITEYQRNSDDFEKEFDDYIFQKDIEILLSQKKFEQSYFKLCEYVKQNKQELSINTKTFITENKNDVSAVSFVFKEQDGECKPYKVIYENGFKSDVLKVEELSIKDYLNFCTEKYQENYNILLNKTIDEIIDNNHFDKNKMNDIQNRIIVGAAEKQIESQSQAIDSFINIKKYSNIDDLIESYKQDKSEKNISTDAILKSKQYNKGHPETPER